MTDDRDVEQLFEGSREPSGTSAVESYAVMIPGTGLMVLRPINPGPSTAEHIEQLRVLRNECRESMTGFTGEITPSMQMVWWQDVAGSPAWRIWLAYDEGHAPIGFGMLSQRRRPPSDRRMYVTLGVTAERRGRMYGTMIYRTLANIGMVVHAVIREDNAASIKAATRAGYARTLSRGPEGTITMIGGM